MRKKKIKFNWTIDIATIIVILGILGSASVYVIKSYHNIQERIGVLESNQRGIVDFVNHNEKLRLQGPDEPSIYD
jgi:hypothetical protein